MKVAYVTHTRFPTEKAHGHQVAHVASALSALGHKVTVVAPGVRNNIHQDHVKYYNLSQKFPIENLPTYDALQSPIIPGRFAMRVTMRSYRGSIKKYFADNTFDLLYARSPHVVASLISTGMPVALELHALPKRGRSRFVALCNKCTLVVCLTSAMQQELLSWGVKKKKTIVEGDAVDLSRFKNLPSVASAKHHFHVPEGVPVIGYVGSLVTMDRLEKGVDLLLRAAANLKKKKEHVFVFIVGGPELWTKKYRKLALSLGLTDHDFLIHGPVQSKLVSDAIKACDICVYPAPDSKHPYFVRDTSPLKLFEYLASGQPILCADIPPVRDIVTKDSVRFFHPGSVSSLIGGIREMVEHPKESKERAKNGAKIVKNHTWEKRMERIIQELPQ